MGLPKPAWPVLQVGNPLANGVVTACPVFEGSGAANDIANSGAATAFAAPPWVGSPYGSALSFNGSNQGIGLARNSGLTTSTPFMVSVLFNAASLASGFQCIAGTGQESTLDGIYLSLRSSTLSLQINDVFINILRVDVTAAISTNTWYLVDYVYDGSKTAAGVRIFLNGAEQALTVVNNTLSSSINDRPWAIGAAWSTYPSSLLDFFNGKVGLLEVRTGLGLAGIVAQKAADPFAIYRSRTRFAQFVSASAPPAACAPTLSLLGVGCGIQAARAMIRNRVVGRRGVVAELLGVNDE